MQGSHPMATLLPSQFREVIPHPPLIAQETHICVLGLVQKTHFVHPALPTQWCP
ncbi:rCG20534 [Rattus norvegicus]|uniref:RCG20534 n=1 Tax=Rattus norvegicus TaxID=10116 RepID=A6K5H6_RAT|nr:rCG20534 [Rattus norvegicus]